MIKKTRKINVIAEKLKSSIESIDLSKIKTIVIDRVTKFLKLFLDKRIYIIILFLIMTLAIVYEYNYVANYSVYSSDDFTHYIQMGMAEGFNLDDNFNNGIAYVKWHLNVWGGVYFGMFLHGIIGVNNKVRDLTGLRFWMSVNVILYFASVFIFFISLVSNIIMKEKAFIEKLTVSSVLSFVFILLFNGFNFYEEPFTWFPAAASYSVGVSLFLLSFAIMMSFKFEKKVSNIVLNIVKFLIAALLAICSMGTSISVVMLGWILIFAYLIYAFVENKINIGNVLLSLVFIRFGLFNIMAPGNFARRETAKQGIDIKETLDTLMMFLKKRIDYINSRYLLIVCIILFSLIAAYFIYKNVKISKSYMIVSAFLFILPFAVTGPIAFGYSPDWELYDRNNFMIDMSIIIVYINAVILLSGAIIYLFENLIKENEKIVPVVVFSLFAIISINCFKNFEKIDLYQFESAVVLNDIINEKYKKFDEEYMIAFNELLENVGKDVAYIHYPNEDDVPEKLYFYPELNMYMYQGFFNIKNIKRAK